MQGYIVFGQHNGSFAFYGRSDVRRCEKCGELLAKWDESLAGLKIKRRKYEVSATYDGVTVVSRRFQSVYDSNRLEGLVFQELPSAPDFLAVMATDVVQFDAKERETRFINKCPVCGRFEEVIGATPAYLMEGEVVPDRGFVRSDLEFASFDEKGPLILCGPAAGEVLKKARFRGLDLEEF